METFRKTQPLSARVGLLALTLTLAGTLVPATAQAAPAGVIPARFPISQGLGHLAADPDTRVEGPARTRRATPKLSYCGTRAFGPKNSTQRLSVSMTGPEWGHRRSLVGYRRVADAKAALRRFKRVAAACPRDGLQRNRLRTAATDHPSVTVGTYYELGVGAGITQVTRQGSWLLLVDFGAEGIREDLPMMTRQATRISNKLGRTVATLPGA